MYFYIFLCSLLMAPSACAMVLRNKKQLAESLVLKKRTKPVSLQQHFEALALALKEYRPEDYPQNLVSHFRWLTYKESCSLAPVIRKPESAGFSRALVLKFDYKIKKKRVYKKSVRKHTNHDTQNEQSAVMIPKVEQLIVPESESDISDEPHYEIDSEVVFKNELELPPLYDHLVSCEVVSLEEKDFYL